MRITAESLRRRASESSEISHWIENTVLTESELLQMYFDHVNEMLEDDDDAFPPDFDDWATIQLTSFASCAYFASHGIKGEKKR